MELLAIKQIIIILLGMAVIIGLISFRKAVRIILRMLLVPIALIIGWYLLQHVWHQLSPLQQFLAVVLGVPSLLGYLLFGTRFGREVLASIIGDFLYDVLRVVVRYLHWILLGLFITGLLISLWA